MSRSVTMAHLFTKRSLLQVGDLTMELAQLIGIYPNMSNATHSCGLILKLSCSSRDKYVWRLCGPDGTEIAQGSAGSFAEAYVAGERQAKLLRKNIEQPPQLAAS